MADETGYENFKEGLVDKLSYLLGTFNFINYDIEGRIDDLVKSCLAEGERRGGEKKCMHTKDFFKGYDKEIRQQALKEVEEVVKAKIQEWQMIMDCGVMTEDNCKDFIDELKQAIDQLRKG